MLERVHACFHGLLVLVAHVNLARGILAYEHHREARRNAVRLLELCHLAGDPGAKTRGERLAIDDCAAFLYLLAHAFLD